MKPKTPNNFEPFPGGEDALLQHFAQHPTEKNKTTAKHKTFVVIGQHKHYRIFSAQLVQGDFGKNGQLKNPLRVINPLDFMWQANRAEDLKFFAAISKFQQFYEKSHADVEALRALFVNPKLYDFYVHDHHVSEKISTKSIRPASVSFPDVQFYISIDKKADTYIVKAHLDFNQMPCPINEITVELDQFLLRGNHWYFIEQSEIISTIKYLKKQGDPLLLSVDNFKNFQFDVLAHLEDKIEIRHLYASAKANKKNTKKAKAEKLIYLSDYGSYIGISPVMKYGEQEVLIRSKKQLIVEGGQDLFATLKRDQHTEDLFHSMLIRQHPHFQEQMDNPLLYYYLHKNRFLDENWFLNTFEEWRQNNVQILGFNQIRGTRLNPNKAKVDIEVTSGLDWFNADIKLNYGNKRASLKQIKKAVKNRLKYVTLDDGSQGVLPEEWLQKFERYFNSGTIVDEDLQIPKTAFARLDQLFETHMLDEEVTGEILTYQEKLSNFKHLTKVKAPKELKATLRPYQLEGLSWLKYLHEFVFGGCLADDMGLGKTVQVIAFMLWLKQHEGFQNHLLVVPTSLIHNWQQEINRFAPSLKVHIHHGIQRGMDTSVFENFDVIITTYNILMSDIHFMRHFSFSYAVLDESQNIKNTNSQRYKAAKLINSKNRLTLTGTPIENNTFDLYAQLSFTCPDLLGTKTWFRHTYAIPIDKFKHNHSIHALQKTVSPFVLRRTKKEVATELPDKTEMVLYCEMGPNQRKIYDAYEREFREYIEAHTEDELERNPMHALRGITRLRQICDAPSLIGEDKMEGETPAKIRALMEQLRSVSGNHKVLVFSQFVSMLSLIEKELNNENIGYCKLTGSTTKRADVVAQFQEDDITRVFLISLKAGGTGLNLTAADYVFLIDPWWNPAVENQAIDRVYRIGQQKHVIAARFICPDTVEDKIQHLQADKAERAEALIQVNGKLWRELIK